MYANVQYVCDISTNDDINQPINENNNQSSWQFFNSLHHAMDWSISLYTHIVCDLCYSVLQYSCLNLGSNSKKVEPFFFSILLSPKMKSHTLWVHPLSYSAVIFLNLFYSLRATSRQHIEIPIRNFFEQVTLTFDLWPWSSICPRYSSPWPTRQNSSLYVSPFGHKSSNTETHTQMMSKLSQLSRHRRGV